MPKLLNSCLALLYISDRLSRLFEGIQPIFKQVPPNVFLDSTSNGLTYAIEKFKSFELAGHISLVKGERSKVATLAAKVL